MAKQNGQQVTANPLNKGIGKNVNTFVSVYHEIFVT